MIVLLFNLKIVELFYLQWLFCQFVSVKCDPFEQKFFRAHPLKPVKAFLIDLEHFSRSILAMVYDSSDQEKWAYNFCKIDEREPMSLDA